jgi:cytochrome b
MSAPHASRVLVWDWPVRVFHWGLVLAFAGAYLLGDSERWRLMHVALGYVALALIAFRVAWGVIGSRPARFSAFVRSPRAVVRCLASLARRQPEPHTGHNPAGGWAILAILGLGLATGLSGWLRYQDLGGEWLEEVHEVMANAWLALVALHILAVIASSLLHRENLVRAMLTGTKRGDPAERAARAHGVIASILLGAVVTIGIVSSRAPAPDAAAAPRAMVAPANRNDQD